MLVTAEAVSLPSDQDASGRTLGEDEIAALQAVINSGTLNSTKGSFVKQFETDFAKLVGAKHAFACANGSAAVHLAIAAINPEPGDEIITTSITDMGALTPILYQGAIPVFCDVDPETCNVTAADIKKCITDKTKAIIVTHLFGNPCEMDEILSLAKENNIPVIEDSAQAFMATYDGKYVGTLGAVGCFSLQQGKHITTGEGGLVVCNDDAIARRMFLFVNKAWGYGDKNPDHYFAALNYRLTELQGAVAVAQLKKLDWVAKTRIDLAQELSKQLTGVRGLRTPKTNPRAVHTYWKYCLRVDDTVVSGGSVALAAALREYGIASAPRYIQKPAFECQVFQDQNTFGSSRWPFTLASPSAVDYSKEKFPGTYEALEGILVLPFNEKYTQDHIDFIAESVKACIEDLTD
ncbi:MAG: DegT/DnrJ/EryC1/StrS family aminotransferase [Gammaproteobacteria bacterium]|nr:DegT/DnrJ/EryC1/StrS family aminotransferase [Gammaproteobacteria bacterium]